MSEWGGVAADVTTVCRTCLVSMGSADLLPLFPSLEPTARARRKRDLHRATGLLIAMNDGLPQRICKACADLVNTALYLRDMSLSSEQKLLRIGDKINLENSVSMLSVESSPDVKSIQYVDIDNNFDASSLMLPLFEEDSNAETKDDVESDPPFHNDVKFNIVLPDAKLYSENRYNIDQTTNSKNVKERKNIKKEKNYKKISPTALNTSSKDLKRIKFTEMIKKCQEFSDGPLNVDGPIRCKLCKRLCNGLSSFSIHLRIHIGFDHVCEFCGKKFYAAIGLKRHCMSWHGVEKELACGHCHYRATSSSRLREHERTHTGERPYECDECGGKFHTRSSIVQHLRLHINRKTLQCDRCPSMFKNRRALTTHINQSHVRDYLYLCYVCDKRYSKNTSARKHLSRVHGVPRHAQGKIPRFSLSKSAVVN